MSNVAKYNVFKGVSTLLTLGTPIVTLACCGNFFVERSDRAISAAAMFAILLSLFFVKDKIAENFKMPAPFVLCIIMIVLITIVKNIMLPVEAVCWATLVMTGIDEMSFRSMYKKIEKKLPEKALERKKFGFIFAKNKHLTEDK